RVHAEIAGNLLLQRDGLRAGQRLGLDFPVDGVALMDLLHDGAVDAAVGDRVLYLAERRGRRGEGEDGPALEVDAEVEAADEQRHDADDQDAPGDRVPQALPADEVDRYLAAVELAAQIAQARHHEPPVS